jgi:hypothetical protein
MDCAGFGTSACDKRLFDLDPIRCGWRYSIILVAWVANHFRVSLLLGCYSYPPPPPPPKLIFNFSPMSLTIYYL